MAVLTVFGADREFLPGGQLSTTRQSEERVKPDNSQTSSQSSDALVYVGEGGAVSVLVIGETDRTSESNETSSRGRDPRVDTLRGLFLVLMMLDHLPQHPLFRFSAQTFGFVSAAEGFVFVSGVVSALVYGRTLANQGTGSLRRRAWRRARDIYFTHLFLYSVALVGGLLGGWQIASQFPNFWGGWWHGAALIYQPRLFGILPMYTVFMLALPLVLHQMARGRALLVWSASTAMWLAAQWGIGGQAHNPPWLQTGFFNILAWQLLFVAGVYFGYRAGRRRSLVPRSRLVFVFSTVLVTGIFLVRHQTFFFGKVPLIDLETALGEWKSIVHPFRLMNFAAWAYVLWYLPRWVDEKANKLGLFRWLRFLGGHSLQVFGWSTLISYAAFSFKDPWASLPAAWKVTLAVSASLSLFIPAWIHEQWKSNAALRTGRAS